MERQGQQSVPATKEFQTEGSWAPATPLKPTIPRPGPICEDGQRGGLMGQPFMNESEDTLMKFSTPNGGPAQSLGPTCSLSSSAEMSMPNFPPNTGHGDSNIQRVDDRVIYQRVNVQPQTGGSYPNFAACEAPLAQENDGQNSSYPSIGFENMSFGELLSMGPDLARSLISDPLEDTTSSTFHGLNPQPGTNNLDNTSAFWNQQSLPHSGYPWSQCSVNSSPRTTHVSGEYFAFPPRFPHTRCKAEAIVSSVGTSMAAQQLNGLQEHGVAAATVDSQGLNSKEVEPATCSSPGKVSIAGEENRNPRRTPRPKTPKPTEEKEAPRNKRKYVRKNKADTTSYSATGETKTTENKPKKQTSKSCKKSLNFDLDREENTAGHQSSQTVNQRQREDLVTETSQVGVGLRTDDDLAQQANQEVSHSDQATLAEETEKATGNLMGNNVGETSSPCASCSVGVQRRGSKRVLSGITGKAEVDAGNVATNHGTCCPPNHIFLHNVDNNGVPNFAIPEIHKKQRIDQGEGLHAPSTSSYVNASKYYHNTLALHRSNVGMSNQVEMLMRCAGNKVQLLNTWAEITRLKTTSQPTGTLHAHNLDPLEGVPLFSNAESSGKGKASRRKKSEISKTHQPGSSSHSDQPNCVDSNMGAPIEDTNKKPKPKPKRRSKKQSQLDRSTSAFIPMLPLSMSILLEAITLGLKQLDLNKEQSAHVPHPQNALVLYKNDGTLVPFEGQFDPVRKRGQRPKVELDDETTRVWMLLLENIDNEGIDGTTEEKRKWWESERSVFRGRVDSFIARMRLVQGDRRFTPWKGSVLDSVIGVFLTQNVSDHLSSSAFMSLAAHFPIKPNSSGSAGLEEIVEPEESVTRNEKSVDQPTYARTNNETDRMKMEDVNSQERVIAAASGSVGPVDCSSQSSLKTNTESSFSKDDLGDYRAWDGATSSLQSMISSQNSDKAQPDGGTRTESNSIAQSVASSSQSDYFGCSTSFLGLLRMAETPILHDSYNQILGCDPGKAPNIGSGDHQVHKESDFQLKNTTSIQIIEVESKSSATFKKDEIWKDSLGNVRGSTLRQTNTIWNDPNLPNLSREAADVTTGSTVTLDKTTNDQKEVSGHNYALGGISNIADANPQNLARLALPGPEERRIVASNNENSIPRDPHNNIEPLPLPPPTITNDHPHTNFSCNKDATIVEVPSTSLSPSLTEPTFNLERQPQVHCEPIVEVPASPEPEPENEQTLCDIEDSVYEDPNEIPTIELNMEKFTETLQNVMQANRELQESGMSRALVALTPEAASIPTPKLKNISRLRTEHHV